MLIMGRNLVVVTQASHIVKRRKILSTIASGDNIFSTPLSDADQRSQTEIDYLSNYQYAYISDSSEDQEFAIVTMPKFENQNQNFFREVNSHKRNRKDKSHKKISTTVQEHPRYPVIDIVNFSDSENAVSSEDEEFAIVELPMLDKETVGERNTLMRERDCDIKRNRNLPAAKKMSKKEYAIITMPLEPNTDVMQKTTVQQLKPYINKIHKVRSSRILRKTSSYTTTQTCHKRLQGNLYPPNKHYTEVNTSQPTLCEQILMDNQSSNLLDKLKPETTHSTDFESGTHLFTKIVFSLSPSGYAEAKKILNGNYGQSDTDDMTPADLTDVALQIADDTTEMTVSTFRVNSHDNSVIPNNLCHNLQLSSVEHRKSLDSDMFTEEVRRTADGSIHVLHTVLRCNN